MLLLQNMQVVVSLGTNPKWISIHVNVLNRSRITQSCWLLLSQCQLYPPLFGNCGQIQRPSECCWVRAGLTFGTFSLRGLAVLACGGAVLPCSRRAGTVTSSPSPAARLGSLVLTLIIPMARTTLQLGNSKGPSLVHACDITIFSLKQYILFSNTRFDRASR